MSLKTAILSEKHSLDFSKRFSPFLTDVRISRAFQCIFTTRRDLGVKQNLAALCPQVCGVHEWQHPGPLPAGVLAAGDALDPGAAPLPRQSPHCLMPGCAPSPMFCC